LFYALVAIAIGVLVFIYVVIPFEARHPFSFPFGAAYLTIEFHSALRLGTILLVVALVAAFIPAWRTIRIKILDAIWG
jgi:ABC-type antimicrobial peptide transport system permease subunit